MAEPRERSVDTKRQGDKRDQKWNARYRELEAFKAEHGHCKVPESHGSLGKWVKKHRELRKKNKLSKERIQKLDALGFDWSPQGTPWEERLDELTKYKAERGDCSVPQSQGPLGKWVKRQRAAYKKNTLSEECVKKLEDIGFSWGNTHSAVWDERLDELTKYEAEHDHCNVPQRQGPLGVWVHTQRIACKRGKLSEERVQKLDCICFSWGATPLTWDERLNELTKYEAEHGDCNVPRDHESLGFAVIHQRQAYKKGKLSEERVKKLKDLGFSWATRSTPNVLPWDERLNELMNYKAEHGHCNIPKRQGPLGTWVQNQRAAYKKGKLSEERVRKLDALGFCWGRGTIPKSKRRPTRGRRSRSDARVAGEDEGAGGRERKRRNADNDDAGTDSVPALPEECVSNAAEYDVETDSEVDTNPLKPEDVLIKAETDDESSIDE